RRPTRRTSSAVLCSAAKGESGVRAATSSVFIDPELLTDQGHESRAVFRLLDRHRPLVEHPNGVGGRAPFIEQRQNGGDPAGVGLSRGSRSKELGLGEGIRKL